MKVAILGTRGIPNQYGGFEQFAEKVSLGLFDKGHEVTVYNPHFHEYQANEFEGVNIIHKYSPESKLGAAANFIYDYLCLRDALKRDFDIILECGYQSASISYFLCPIQKSTIVTNMDGMEWKRSKWSNIVQKLTKLFEKWGAIKSHALIADNKGIQKYLAIEYQEESTMIPYGAELFTEPDPSVLNKFDVNEFNYHLLIARLEPENNIETILDGYSSSNSKMPFLVVGNHETSYGNYLKEKYINISGIRFLGGIYKEIIINNLRHYTNIYFHGHSVGGTNPSLLEAMACGALIVAHDNEFNKSVLRDNGLYFNDKDDIKYYLNNAYEIKERREELGNGSMERIKTVYSWERIIDDYEEFFVKVANNQ